MDFSEALIRLKEGKQIADNVLSLKLIIPLPEEDSYPYIELDAGNNEVFKFVRIPVYMLLKDDWRLLNE